MQSLFPSFFFREKPLHTASQISPIGMMKAIKVLTSILTPMLSAHPGKVKCPDVNVLKSGRTILNTTLTHAYESLLRKLLDILQILPFLRIVLYHSVLKYYKTGRCRRHIKGANSLKIICIRRLNLDRPVRYSSVTSLHLGKVSSNKAFMSPTALQSCISTPFSK